MDKSNKLFIPKYIKEFIYKNTNRYLDIDFSNIKLILFDFDETLSMFDTGGKKLQTLQILGATKIDSLIQIQIEKLFGGKQRLLKLQELFKVIKQKKLPLIIVTANSEFNVKSCLQQAKLEVDNIISHKHGQHKYTAIKDIKKYLKLPEEPTNSLMSDDNLIPNIDNISQFVLLQQSGKRVPIKEIEIQYLIDNINLIQPKINSHFTLISWNLQWNKHIKEEIIIKYFSSIDVFPDIFLTQETIINLDKYKSNYSTIPFSNSKTAISINFNRDKFYLLNTSKVILFNNEGKKDKNGSRPMIAIKLKNLGNNENIILLNIHAPHKIVEKNESEFLNTISYLVSNIGYQYGDRIIIAGDFNEFYTQYSKKHKTNNLNINGKILYLKQQKKTCCGDTTKISNIGYVSDLLFDSKDEMIVKPYISDISDHLPIIGYSGNNTFIKRNPGELKTTYSIYLVPIDFGNNFEKKHWEKWGNKHIPHVTLMQFFEIDLDKLKIIVNQIAQSSPLKKSRWSFGKRLYNITGNKQGDLRILHFHSNTIIEKLKKYIPNKMKDELHITLGILRETYKKTFKEDEIIKRIKDIKDWKLVIAEQQGNKVEWIYDKELYD